MENTRFQCRANIGLYLEGPVLSHQYVDLILQEKCLIVRNVLNSTFEEATPAIRCTYLGKRESTC